MGVASLLLLGGIVEWKIITTSQEFLQLTKDWTGPVACDTETAKDTHLLGISFSINLKSLYIPITQFILGEFVEVVNKELKELLSSFLKEHLLIGHNFTYDKRFIDQYFSIQSNWIF